MKRKLSFGSFNLAQRLILYNVIFAIAIIALGTFALQRLVKSLIYEGIYREMEIQLKAKKYELESYFQDKGNDLKIIRNSYAVTQGFLEMQKGFEEKLKQLQTVENSRNYFRKLYVEQNPYPPSSRMKFSQADDSDYSKAHAKYLPYLRAVLEERNYYDVLIMDAKTGDIIFTVMKESDYMTNLINGPYKDTNIARLFRNIVASKEGAKEVFFADYEPYAPSYGIVSSFIGTGIFINEKLVGVLVFQLPIAEITERVARSYSDARSGRIFLVGSDFFLRTDPDPNSSASSFILKVKVQTESVREALAGRKGHFITEAGYGGKKSFTSFAPIEFFGNRFALILELDYEETIRELKQFQVKAFLVSLIVLATIIGTGYWFSKSIAKPIQDSVSILSTSTREISSVVENHERTAQMLSAAVNETTTTLSNISNSSQESAEESQLVTTKAKRAMELSLAGHDLVVEMMRSIDELKLKVSSIAEQILRLSEKNSQINDIITLVSEIANETNMLALNAAVEAARAGEEGKGFEVVAVEIRKLADESRKSALKIQEIISETKSATDSTVMVTEEGVKKAEESVNLGSKVLDSLSGISSSVSSVSGSIEKISLNIQKHSVSIGEIVSAMNSINKGSHETANGIAETKVGIEQIVQATRNMQDLVEGR
ncbi:MAG: methyl-accepting chemotaxis protein [Leptospiraceae bacterium]|nr:methyl-accepting chemotaxis protein [Leptospiraceae bacterium]